MRVLVAILEKNEEAEFNHVFAGASNRAYPKSAELDIDGRSWWDKCTLWDIDEKDIAVTVDVLTRQHPGKEVCVYNLSTIYYRPTGELSSKAVTKDGVLPF